MVFDSRTMGRLEIAMGEIADDIINGDCCQICGCYFEDEGAGYPRTCNSCGGEGGDTL